MSIWGIEMEGMVYLHKCKKRTTHCVFYFKILNKQMKMDISHGRHLQKDSNGKKDYKYDT